MAKFALIEMTNKKEFPKPVPINFDHVISLTPHKTDHNRYMLVFERGAEYDAIIPADVVDWLCDVER